MHMKNVCAVVPVEMCTFCIYRTVEQGWAGSWRHLFFHTLGQRTSLVCNVHALHAALFADGHRASQGDAVCGRAAASNTTPH